MVAAALALAGCGGGGGAPAGNGGGTQMSAYDTAAAAIAAATTDAAVDRAVADATASVSGAELARLQTEAAKRKMALAKMARVEAQRKALADAGEIDTSDLSDAERIAAAKADIAALRAALDGAADVSDADRATYRTKLAAAQTAVDRQEQLNAVMGASMTLAAALKALSDAGSTPTAAQVTAAGEALAALNAAIAAGGHLTEAQKARYGSEAGQAPARIASAKTLLDAEDVRKEDERVAGIVRDITDTEIAAAMTAVGVVTDMSGDGDVTSAQGAIDAARARIDGADIPDGSRQMLRTALAVHEGSLSARKASRLAYQERMGREERERLRTAKIKEITDGAIQDARDAVAEVMNDSDQATLDAAQSALAAARAAIEAPEADGVLSDNDQRDLHAMVEKEQGKFDKAVERRLAHKRNRIRIAGIVEAITDGEIAAVGTAIELIDGLSEESTVTDAEAAVAAAKAAIEAARIPDPEKADLRARLAVQEDALAAARTARMDAHKMGRALYAAMGPSDDTTAPVNALNNLATVPYYITSITDSQHDAPAEATGQRGERGDFRIDPAAGAGSIATANTHTAVYFRHGMPGRPGHDTAMDKVGRWGVTHYERTTGSGSMKVTDRVRVYNDRQGGPLERWGVVPMDAAKFFKDDTDWINKGTYTPADRKLSLGTGVDRAIASPKFDTWTVGIGSVTAPKPADGGAEIKVSGTYYGAKGTYFCPVSGTCTVGTGVGGGGFGGYFLSADWYFVHETGAKVLERDLSYMYFGWWVRNDADGMPAAVSAFYQAVGGGVELATDGKSLNVNRGRAATYEGPAIGWYAINDPLNEKGDGGEFTATAKLKAQFGTANLNADTGLTGTIDRFRLKGGSGDPDWSVTLNKAAWTTDPSLATDAQKGHIVNTEKTVWSINGVKAAPAGSWVANLYDDKPGTVENGGDGSNHPTAIMGKWQAGHGGTHRMVGAFGTELQAP